jgi:cytoskeletal protein CcmA (bactofilin family)
MSFFRDIVPSTRDTPTPAAGTDTHATGRGAPDSTRRSLHGTEQRPGARGESRLESPPESRPEPRAAGPAESASPLRVPGRESLLGPELTIEGKIEGIGHVRIAGRFKGDLNIQGSLSIELGAHVAGQVKAKHVVVAGTLEGNIDGAERVELQQSGVLIGDVKAGSLVVAGGSKMRGQVEFGWGEPAAGQVPRPATAGQSG